ncbi:hypothetical protein ACFC1R_29830 [Kitasatospora sp. NPDC056138]|uniref:hypothetical protein n=1 Tax=Kitasatospora sp. NPDC056138 TaxID=3345724 RepID=UPI0035DD6758
MSIRQNHRTAPAAASLTAVLAVLALQCATGTSAQAQAAGQPHTVTAMPAPAPVPTAAPAADGQGVQAHQVRITEGQVREAGRGSSILYPSVTSCLTVTVRLRGGGLVGAHASLFQVPGEYRSDRILAALRKQVGDRGVSAVEVRGAVGAWDPGYLVKAIESYGPNEEVPYPVEPDPDGIARTVAHGLGQPREKVTVEDVPDGDITVR